MFRRVVLFHILFAVFFSLKFVYGGLSTDAECSNLLGEPCQTHDIPLRALHRAALFTPFGLTPGNGERYLLSFVQVLKKLSFEIDIILFEDNECFMSTCVEESLKTLRLKNTNYDDFTIRLIPETSQVFTEFDEYDIFVAMGINKFPSVPVIKPVGKYYNIYICQFPFDWKRGMKDMDLKIDVWASYDTILVNSRYTFDWYVNGVVPWIHRGLNRNIFVPTLSLLHPPVDPFPTNNTSSGNKKDKEKLARLPDRADVTNIVVLGPFHFDTNTLEEGLKFFKELVSKATTPLHLHYIGRVEPATNAELFASSIEANSTLLGLRVSFDLDATPESMGNVLSTAMIAWHLLGVYSLGPAQHAEPSGDTFATILVEAMFAGCIPVATNIGGTSDIVHPPVNGFLINNEDDVVQHTLQLLAMSDADIARLRKSSQRTAHAFSGDAFNKNLKDMLSKGVRSYVVRDVVRRRIPEMWSVPLQIRAISVKYYAVLIAPAMHSTLEAVVRNVMFYLGSKWSLRVFHTKANEAYVKQVLAGVANVIFQPLKIPIHRPSDYNRLLKSAQFWSLFRDGDKVVLFNLDTIMLRSGIDSYIHFDYIGSPLPLSYTATATSAIAVRETTSSTVGGGGSGGGGGGGGAGKGEDSHKQARAVTQTVGSGGDRGGGGGGDGRRLSSKNQASGLHKLGKAGVGFAGFSLRSAGAMLRIAKEYGSQTDDSEPESLFFARMAAQLDMRVADRRKSFEFSWELDCPDLLDSNSKIPLALQGAWNHMNLSIINPLVDKNVIMTTQSLRKLPSTVEDRYYPLFVPPKPEVKTAPVPAAKKVAVKVTEPKPQSASSSSSSSSEEETEVKPKTTKKLKNSLLKSTSGSGPVEISTASSGGGGGSMKSSTGTSSSSASSKAANTKSTSRDSSSVGGEGGGAGGETNYVAAWEAIKNPRYVQDEAVVAELLDKLGIMEAADLAHCEPAHIKQIMELVKPVQKKKIAAYLSKR